MKGRIAIDTELCKGCGLCIEFCPKKVIVVSVQLNAKGYAPAQCRENAGCTGCATCATMCPEAAIEVYRE